MSRAIAINPSIQFGQPCIAGRRITTEVLAEQVMAGDTAAHIAAIYEIERADVLLACWYQATRGTRRWKSRWSGWAEQHWERFWRGQHDEIPDPPVGHPGESQP
jgi:uncharacterized protein (DUF433 family)